MLEPGSITTSEAIYRGRDRHCSASVRQLTSAPGIHINIYGEVPYMDPSSRYLIYLKNRDSYGLSEVWRADLHTDWLTPVCDGVCGIIGAAVSPDQRYFFCIRKDDGSGFEIVRTDIASLEQSVIPFRDAPAINSLGAVGPDNRTYVASTEFKPRHYGIVRYDLETAAWTVIHEGDEICNAHPQIEPGRGEDLLIQYNRGCEFDDQGRCLRLVGDIGATLYLIDRDGGNRRDLPVGKPHGQPVQGHQCWIGDTGEVLLTVVGGSDEIIRDGMLRAVRAGDTNSRAVAGGYIFGHPNASRDGRFFVCDTFGDALLVVGSIRTRKTRVLCETGASFSRPQYTHPHPYFSPDCKSVVYNSDRTGIPHVFAAGVPDGLLEELDADQA